MVFGLAPSRGSIVAPMGLLLRHMTHIKRHHFGSDDRRDTLRQCLRTKAQSRASHRTVQLTFVVVLGVRSCVFV
ncbi:hypothetical protein HanIR_Chr09g0392041 [Helianthus annuus]|nr:hypothetical protein HanIR_Chr09g0392041 [Helianthus annuus]